MLTIFILIHVILTTLDSLDAALGLYNVCQACQVCQTRFVVPRVDNLPAFILRARKLKVNYGRLGKPFSSGFLKLRHENSGKQDRQLSA